MYYIYINKNDEISKQCLNYYAWQLVGLHVFQQNIVYDNLQEKNIYITLIKFYRITIYLYC